MNRAVIPGQAAGLSPESMNTALPVMVGPVPTIHVFLRESAVFKTWMLATRASMTSWIGVVFMGSGLAAELILGPTEGRTRGRCPGMTVQLTEPRNPESSESPAPAY